MDRAAVLGGEPAEIQNLDFEIRLAPEDFVRDHRKPPSLR